MIRSQSPVGHATIGAFLLLTINSNVLADFFLTRSQNPFTLFQGQPLPLKATLPDNDWTLDLSLDITNSLHAQSNTQHDLFVDFESYHFNTRLARRLNQRWAFVIDVPLIHRTGGTLDNAIDSWHRTFGLPRDKRPLVANDQLRIDYSNSSGAFSLTENTTDIGDIATHIGYRLATNNKFTYTLWAGIELPTGDRENLSGNDHTDIHLSVSGNLRLTDSFDFDLHAGATLPGGNLLSGNDASDVVLFSYFSGDLKVAPGLALKAQLEFHQSYFENSSLDLLDNATVLVFGGAFEFDRCNLLEIGVSEDIDVGSSPDVSFLINWRYEPISCN